VILAITENEIRNSLISKGGNYVTIEIPHPRTKEKL